MARNPNAGGKGPKVTKQGKSGPIFGKMTSVTGSTRPFDPNKGSNVSSKPKHATKQPGSSPSKSKGGWYLR